MAAVPSTSASLREGDSAWVILVSIVILDIFKLRFLHQHSISTSPTGIALVVVNLNSDDYSDREIDIFSANQIPAF